MHRFVARDVTFQAVEAAAPLLARIARHDKDLHVQIRRALQSAALNVAESQYSDAGNRRARLHTAAGSANEARAGLQLAVAFGYLAALDAAAADRLLDRAIGLYWGLTRRRVGAGKF